MITSDVTNVLQTMTQSQSWGNRPLPRSDSDSNHCLGMGASLAAASEHWMTIHMHLERNTKESQHHSKQHKPSQDMR